MLLSVFLTLPLVYVFLLCGTVPRLLDLEKNERVFFPLSGAITAVVFSLMLVLFTNAGIRHQLSFSRVFLSLFVRTTVLPFALCSLFFLLWNRQETKRRFVVFSAVLFGFYMIFIPFYTLTTYEVYPWFVSVVFPLLYSAQLSFIAVFLPVFVSAWQTSKRSAPYLVCLCFILLAALVFPALACALWTLSFPWYVTVLPVLILFAGTPVFIFLCRKQPALILPTE